jgi:uncharacterized surface anchored protein
MFLLQMPNAKYALQGLDQGTYYLVEITAPDGYNKLTAAQTVTVTPTYVTDKYVDGHTAGDQNDQLSAVSICLNNGAAAAAAVVENASGSVLPSTGGIGTRRSSHTAASLLMLAAAVALVIAKPQDLPRREQ